MSWLHIQNANVFAPKELGTSDILWREGRIVSVGQHLDPPDFADSQTVDANGRILLPGVVDN
ncbi:MAG TPA: hypothetical protein DIU35_17150 [Candidatus Latescibacteria bacterium]|nr:hypothetical protein [Gemmatimonadota bacterium]HCR19207.1 hypothetical protein [Candidatus Latescibacterota bacterium]